MSQGTSRGSFIEFMLILSVAALALIIAAYVYLPDFQRGLRTVVAEVAPRVTDWFE